MRGGLEPAVTYRPFNGRTFACLKDQSAPDLDIAACEKRICNQVIASKCVFSYGVDAFAGVGISSSIWSGCTGRLLLAEQRQCALRLLRRNLRHIRQPHCAVTIQGCGARKLLGGLAAANV